MKGEKAKDVRAGVKVLMMTEQMPNTPPRMPPARGPKRMAPSITGMWTVVALVTTRGIMPNGVLASSTTMAAIMATPAIHLASFLRFFIFNYLLLSLPLKRMQRNFEARRRRASDLLLYRMRGRFAREKRNPGPAKREKRALYKGGFLCHNASGGRTRLHILRKTRVISCCRERRFFWG